MSRDLMPFGDVFNEMYNDLSKFMDNHNGPIMQIPTHPINSFKSMLMDVKETESGIEIVVNVPGYKKEDITIELNEGNILITAKKEESTETKDDGYVIKERTSGTCKRKYYVGNDVTSEDIYAKMEDGVLTINIKKPEAPAKKTINIE